MIKAHKLTIQKTAHFYTVGTPSASTNYFWIACHGYGQLASNLIRKFEDLGEEHFVVAPEGFSRFYWKGFTGDVGASWMTRADRLDEIADYSNFIRQVYEMHLAKLPKDVKIILLGFSQGCATQCRWILRELPHFHHLVLWGGLLPEDLDYTPHHSYFTEKTISFVYGKEDQFLNEERLQWHLDFAQQQKLDMKVLTFDGKHEIDRPLLHQMASTF